MGLFDFLNKKEVVPFSTIADVLNGFTIESLAMPKMNNPFLLNDTNKHPMIYGYFMGAVDYVTQFYNLNEEDRHTVCIQYFSKNFANNDDIKTEELLKYSKELKQTDDGAHYMLLGSNAIKRWMGEGPIAQYASMGLIRLLNG